MDLYFLFNKDSKNFIGTSLDKSTLTDSVLYHKLSIDSMDDLFGWSWVGDYDTGHSVSLDDSPKIPELELKEAMFNAFFSKYSIEQVIEIIMLDMANNIDTFDKSSDIYKMVRIFQKIHNKYKNEIEVTLGNG